MLYRVHFKYIPEIMANFIDAEFVYLYNEKWYLDHFKLCAENKKIVEYRIEQVDL